MKIYYLFFKILFLYFIINYNYASSSIQNQIIANVGNQIISSYELKNKIKTILFLSNQPLTQVNINNAKKQAMTILINIKLKEGELIKKNISSNNLSVNNYLRDFSKKYNTDIKGLKNIFENNDLDYEFYLDQIKIELAWQQLIFNMYKSKIIINENELNEELKKVNKVNEDLQDYKLSEIEILYENKNKYEEKINEIKNEIVKIGFENAAIKYSIASTSLDGGNLGWVSSKSLSNNIFNILEKMRINQVSRPIIKGESVILLKLIDKRTLSIDKKNLETLKQNIINAKKNELLNLFANNYLSKIKNNVLIEIKKYE